ncbi:PTS system mannose/fructose/sorbose family transporter subunit IID [Lactobacillus sp. YT155]|uniref:PTS system mannose/fructose/sorbose family transporter subunit IID n=1 Tax=Lactobacillus sp. YT155 TaxID=3060955 RepID=UPI00265D6A2F|nr:PTS system mannose/fructose/sorbose family transporter subunit IID [Lactobacillus sp. YT155]MDO1605627.1 PTS system mannose/fructose/sorbose family transporter subunit IID [Lactobacillus sp. YT155]
MSFSLKPNYKNILNKKDLQKLFWRSIPFEHSWNYERMGNVGFSWALMPILKKLYPDKKDFSKALTRHLELYNVTPYISTLPLSIAAAMEETNASDENFSEESISAVKLAMMGPLSGIGDAFYWGTLRILATGIGTSLALQGNILGPILFFLVFNVPHYLIRYYGTFLGYGLGSNVISEVQNSGVMDTITKYATIIGMMVVGAMSKEMVSIDFVTKIGIGKDTSTVQSLLDGIFPGLATLALFGLMYWLLKKKMNPLLIMLLILILSIGAAYFKILGA